MDDDPINGKRRVRPGAFAGTPPEFFTFGLKMEAQQWAMRKDAAKSFEAYAQANYFVDDLEHMDLEVLRWVAKQSPWPPPYLPSLAFPSREAEKNPRPPPPIGSYRMPRKEGKNK